MDVVTDDPMDDVMPETVMTDAPAVRKARPPSPRQIAPRIDDQEGIALDRRNISDWLDSISNEGAIKVVISRKKPKIHNGENVGGNLETVEERINEDYIREMWGGGTFLLQVQTPDRNGQFKYFKGRTVEIAGPPKMHGTVPGVSAAPISGDDPMAEKAFEFMHQHARDERARADRIEKEMGRNHGFDAAALAAINAPLYAQLESALATIKDLQVKLHETATRPPPRDDFRDKLLDRAISDESSRIDALRTGYENRIDRMRDNHDDAIKRLEERHAAAIERMEERHADEIKRMESRHERDLKLSDRQGETTSKATEIATQARIDAFKAENDRLGRDLNAAQARIATLEAKKDQSLTEKADELIKVKEALEGLGGGEEAEKKWYETALDMIGNSEAALKLVDKIGGGAAPPPPEQQQQLPPPGVPFQTGDGNVYVRDAQGNVSIVSPAQLAQLQGRAPRRRRRPAGPGQQRAAAADVPIDAPPDQAELDDGDEDVVEEVAPVRPPKPAEVQTAVEFMENAMKAGAKPETFAATARSLVPGDVLAFIQRVGIDNFLDKVVKPGSALATIRGRQFARTVAKILVGGEG